MGKILERGIQFVFGLSLAAAIHHGLNVFQIEGLAWWMASAAGVIAVVVPVAQIWIDARGRRSITPP